MKGQDSSSARAAGVLFLVAGMVIIALLCWELFMQNERRDERQAQRIEDLTADTSAQPRPASQLHPLETLSKLEVKGDAGDVARSIIKKKRLDVAWNQLRGSAFRNIKLSIRKDRHVSTSPDISPGEPMK